jgi:hypothetical protein
MVQISIKVVDDFIDHLVFGLFSQMKLSFGFKPCRFVALGKITVRCHADNICIQGHTSSQNIWSTPK